MKTIAKLIALILIMASTFTFTACDIVEDGSVVTQLEITLDLYENGQAQTCKLNAKLYNDFAPETVKHILKLVNDGYFNNKCVFDVNNNFAQFGKYELDNDGNYQIKDENVDFVEGEFESNGLSGNTLKLQNGALVLNRVDFTAGVCPKCGTKVDKDEVVCPNENCKISAYNTGKATIAVCFDSSKFNTSNYCVFGKLLNDDGVTTEGADTSLLENKSSADKFATIKSLYKDGDTTIYYNVVTNEYVTYHKNNDGEEFYYNGKYSVNDIEQSTFAGVSKTEEEVKAFNDDKNDNSANYVTVPYKQVVIESVKVVKISWLKYMFS